MEPETYVHRSGRTGRAHATGTCVTLVDRRKEGLIPRIERRAGLKFERVGAPQPADIAKAAGVRVGKAVHDQLDEEAKRPSARAGGSDLFLTAADGILAAHPDPRRALAAALARAAGHVGAPPRSLLTARENWVTLHLIDPAGIQRPSDAYSALRRALGHEVAEEAKSVTLAKDGFGALFDVPPEKMDLFLDALPAEDTKNARILRPETLPAIVEREISSGGGGSWGGRGGGFGGRGGGFSGGRGGGFSGSRGGGFSGGRGGGRGFGRR